LVFLEGFGGAAVVGQMDGRAIGNGYGVLHPGWRLVELALPWAKVYNPYRVEFVPSEPRPLTPPWREGNRRLTSPFALRAFPSPCMERENLFGKPLAGLCRDGPGRAAGASRSDVTQSGPGVGRVYHLGRKTAFWAVRHLRARNASLDGSPERNQSNPERGSGVGRSRSGRTPWRQTPAVGARLGGGLGEPWGTSNTLPQV